MAANIFNSTDEITPHYPFLKTINFERLLPTVKFVEHRYQPELMDDDTYAAILTALDDLENASEEMKKLVGYTRSAFAYLVALHYIPHGNVSIGEMGLQVHESEEIKPASKDRKNDLMRGIHEQAMDSLDLVIEYLNKTASLTVFPDYFNSDFPETSTAHIINTAKEFNSIYPIGTNRWIWRKLKPWLIKAEAKVVAVLGADYFNELITEARAEALTSDNLAIYQDAQKALAYATIEICLTHLSIRISDDGVTVYNNASNPVNDLRTTVDHDRNNAIKHESKIQSQEYLRKIETELQTNASATKYPTYYNSDAYVEPEDEETINDITDDPNPGYFNAL